jgi:prophage regulatory protein
MDRPTSDERLLRFRELRKTIPLSRSTIWRKVKNNEFPQPIRIGKSAVAWIWSDVQVWIEERIAASIKESAK